MHCMSLSMVKFQTFSTLCNGEPTKDKKKSKDICDAKKNSLQKYLSISHAYSTANYCRINHGDAYASAHLRNNPGIYYISRRAIMAQSVSNAAGNAKKLLRIDITSDTVCPWCYVGKKHLDEAIASSNDQYDFQIKWHPFQLQPSAPKEGIDKREYYRSKFGARSESIVSRMTEVFKGLGMQYEMSGLTGNSLDSHRLLYLAGKQDPAKQHSLAEELFNGYFTQAKYIGDSDFLLECARKVGVEGADEFLADPNNGLKEVNKELQQYSSRISGVPYYLINGKYELSGGQPVESFLRAFKTASTNA